MGEGFTPQHSSLWFGAENLSGCDFSTSREDLRKAGIPDCALSIDFQYASLGPLLARNSIRHLSVRNRQSNRSRGLSYCVGQFAMEAGPEE